MLVIMKKCFPFGWEVPFFMVKTCNDVGVSIEVKIGDV